MCVCVCVILYLKPEFTLYISFITIILMIELYRKISYNIVLLSYIMGVEHIHNNELYDVFFINFIHFCETYYIHFLNMLARDPGIRWKQVLNLILRLVKKKSDHPLGIPSLRSIQL